MLRGIASARDYKGGEQTAIVQGKIKETRMRTGARHERGETKKFLK